MMPTRTILALSSVRIFIHVLCPSFETIANDLVLRVSLFFSRGSLLWVAEMDMQISSFELCL